MSTLLNFLFLVRFIIIEILNFQTQIQHGEITGKWGKKMPCPHLENLKSSSTPVL